MAVYPYRYATAEVSACYDLAGEPGAAVGARCPPQTATGFRDRAVIAQTKVPLRRKARADHDRAREIISSLRLELEQWSPAFMNLLGPDDEDFVWIVFDPKLELPRALRLTYCALSKVADDWESHFDPLGPPSRRTPPGG